MLQTQKGICWHLSYSDRLAALLQVPASTYYTPGERITQPQPSMFDAPHILAPQAILHSPVWGGDRSSTSESELSELHAAAFLSGALS